MLINQVLIEDTFAEAFDMTATRVIITAENLIWAMNAAQAMTGFATSVIGCGAEAGIEREMHPHETPDGRPGVSVLVFCVSGKELEKQIIRRVGQCVLTCPSTSVFGGVQGEKRIAMGAQLRYFGDGFQISKVIGGERYWRIPVMDGEFVCQDSIARTSAVGGGNFLVLGETLTGVLDACSQAVEAIRSLPDVIAPFPGGVVRSGSKVGSKYKMLSASTNEAYSPALADLPQSQIPEGVNAVLEIVIDGLSPEAISEAMRRGVLAVCENGPANGIRQVSAGNYGGKLGKHHFHLHHLLSDNY